MSLDNNYLKHLMMRVVLNPRVATYVLFVLFLMVFSIFFGYHLTVFSAAGEGTSPPYYPENSTGGSG